jgi:HAD superfamily hydrolase (TIGR01549 family)
LDQGKTFMFDNDRFGPGVDYHASYLELGACALGPDALRDSVDGLVAYMAAAMRDPARVNSFPTVRQAIEALSALGVPREDWDRFDDLIALHELGTIADRHVDALRALAGRHRLGVVSTIWASSHRFVANLVNAGVRDCFEQLVWSSEHGCVKPAPRLFEQALHFFGVPPERVLFVGDHPARDIDAAKRLGLSAAWIRQSPSYPRGLRAPDLILDDLSDLPPLLR